MKKSTILIASLALVIVFAGSVSVADITQISSKNHLNHTDLELSRNLDSILLDIQTSEPVNTQTTIVNDFEMPI